MKTVGITGRSGCGKSSLTAWLAQQGYPCVDADAISREILQPGNSCLFALQKAFGSDILDHTGALDRRLLADRAFATPQGTRTLTELTFAGIVRRIRQAAALAKQQGAALFFVDGAVIVGTPFERECDAVVVVTAPDADSLRRICARDGISPEMAQRRLDAQPAQGELCRAADYIISNDGSVQRLLEQAERVLAALRREEHEESSE